jgi:hypothetical protein
MADGSSSQPNYQEEPAQREERLKVLHAFDLYYSALRCIFGMRCEEFRNAINLYSEINVLRGLLSRANYSKFSPYLEIIETLDDTLKKHTGSGLSSDIFFFLILLAARNLPPPRRVDWPLKMENTPLLFQEKICEMLGDIRHEQWDNLMLESQAEKSKLALNSYFTNDSIFAPGDKTFEMIDCSSEHLLPDYYEDMWNDIWLWRFDRESMSLDDQLGCLAEEYRKAMDEWAHLYFGRLEWPNEYQEDYDAGDFEKLQKSFESEERIGRYAIECFSEMMELISSNSDVFCRKEKVPRFLHLQLPLPSSFGTLAEWHKACDKDCGPIDSIREKVEEAQTHLLKESFHQNERMPKDKRHAQNGSSRSHEAQLSDSKETLGRVVYSKKSRHWEVHIKGGRKEYALTEPQARVMRQFLEANQKGKSLTNLEIREAIPTFKNVEESFCRGSNRVFFDALIEVEKKVTNKRLRKYYSLKNCFEYEPK